MKGGMDAWVPLCHPGSVVHRFLGSSVEQLTQSLLQGVLVLPQAGEAGGSGI